MKDAPENLPVKLSGATGVPYYRQIVDQIGQLIRSGQMGAGSRLPSVRDLSSQLLVSLITTRRAYEDLESLGLVVRRQGYGTFVAEEIEMASHEQAKSEAHAELTKVVDHGRRLGLSDQELRGIFDRVLHEGRDADGSR
jgi:GntR family transcriptional regulator